jgi:hypothetical protein
VVAFFLCREKDATCSRSECRRLQVANEFEGSFDGFVVTWLAVSEAAAAEVKTMRDFIEQPVHMQRGQSAAADEIRYLGYCGGLSGSPGSA